ncbi:MULTISPECIES: BfmA/BtgA family mobilization protein [Mucilaginibacter]|jgi:hypothetical protein|nr:MULTISPECIES: BfmA/BtgA family mobilization protein [Mucilaginibacter]MBB5396935.1 hypothetical protein [Mucilaginibacter sp. AK015]MBL4678566.1 hypothetical protein [Mucilaginibacter sp.]
MQDINTRSVRYPEAVDQKFEKIALKLGRTKRQIFIQMVDYFYKSKKDPMDLNDEMLKNSLIKNHKDLIGFIKTQENDLLIPTRREVDRMVEAFRNVITFFNETLSPSLNTMLAGQQTASDRFKLIADVMKRVELQQTGKDQLKKQFVLILEGYVKARENISGFNTGREKEELLSTTKAQIEILR